MEIASEGLEKEGHKHLLLQRPPAEVTQQTTYAYYMPFDMSQPEGPSFAYVDAGKS